MPPATTTRSLPAHQLRPLDLHQRYTIDEAAAYLRCCRARVYQHINSGRLVTVSDGRRKYVPGRSIAELSETSAPSGVTPPAAG
jgi:excisionase family DNA binding protein